MTKRTFNISIKKPCSENWENMTPHEKGRHCFSCQKTVVDFTTMSDSQIIHYFQTYQGKTCGRFLETQVNRPILPPVLPKNQTRWAWLFSVLLLPMSAKAQTPQYNTDLVELHENQIDKVPQKAKASKKHKKQKDEVIRVFTIEKFSLGFTNLQETPPPPTKWFKSSEDILQDWFTGFKSLFMTVLSFFKSL